MSLGFRLFLLAIRGATVIADWATEKIGRYRGRSNDQEDMSLVELFCQVYGEYPKAMKPRGYPPGSIPDRMWITHRHMVGPLGRCNYCHNLVPPISSPQERRYFQTSELCSARVAKPLLPCGAHEGSCYLEEGHVH